LQNVLWLVSWYPNRLDKFDGDFIQRHAKAAALYCHVQVIYVKKDEHLIPGTMEQEITESGNLTEQVIYYNASVTGIPLLDKFLSQKKYQQHFRGAINQYISRQGKPASVHVHVAMKAGVLALWLKKKRGLSYIVSEHWTAYLEEADERVSGLSLLYRAALEKVLANASAVTTVSDYLGKSIQRFLPGITYTVIPNVVDTGIFSPATFRNPGSTRFIHISNMNYQKNTEAILQAMALVTATAPAELYLYGPVNNRLKELITANQLSSFVFLMGEVPQADIAKAVQQSDALILYSRFETFGCVLIEANACGVPVMVSDLAVFHEIVQEGINGFFVEGNNPAALAEKMKAFAAQCITVNKEMIAATAAEKYNFNKVGQQFLELYHQHGSK
jgi:glycosyltransferase involved in cell wall biosynthesis